jgi:hypothetical protein
MNIHKQGGNLFNSSTSISLPYPTNTYISIEMPITASSEHSYLYLLAEYGISKEPIHKLIVTSWVNQSNIQFFITKNFAKNTDGKLTILSDHKELNIFTKHD